MVVIHPTTHINPLYVPYSVHLEYILLRIELLFWSGGINFVNLVVTVCTTIFYTEKFYVLPTEYICIFSAVLRRSDYFCVQNFRFL